MSLLRAKPIRRAAPTTSVLEGIGLASVDSLSECSVSEVPPCDAHVAVGVGSGALGPVSLCGTGSDCQPGVELHVGGFLDASGGGLSITQVSWRGRDYDMVGFDPALSLHPFGMVTLPEFGDLREVTLTTPFRMTGVFSELQLSQLTPIAGRGIATIRLVRDFDVPRWTDGSVRYDFQAPAAVPEPASMLLFGSGLAGLVAFRRRRCNRVTNEVPQ
jgi:hypothetical protein